MAKKITKKSVLKKQKGTGPFETADLSRIKTRSLPKRKSLASASDLAKIPTIKGAGPFFDSLPKFLKANDLKSLIKDILNARKKNKPVIFMAGGHFIKVGLGPVVIDLINHGLVTGICFNGAGLIHDFEMAVNGSTSEDVSAGLQDGSFGTASETSIFFNNAVAHANAEKIGLGQSAGQLLSEAIGRKKNCSILAACHKNNIPAMIHIAVDTDIVCLHPGYNPASAAKASHHDFKILTKILSTAENGGVFVNIGSAVILPEVFLKALSLSRNIYGHPKKIVTANFDMIQHYRPTVNVVQRPTTPHGTGYSFTGHHEIMIPLLAWGLKTGL